MQIIKKFIPISKSKRPGRPLNLKKITIHSTGNSKSTARNERGWLSNPSNTRSASWHYVVDENTVIQAIPNNEVAYHSGTSAGNNTSIGIEMCETGNRDKVIQNTIELVVHLIRSNNLTEKDVVRHFDWSGKNCPRTLNYNNWQGWTEFKTLLALEMKGGKKDMTKNEVKNIVKEVLEEQANQKQQSWSNEAIAYVKKNNIMQGYKDGSFKPNKPVTRAELAQVIYNMKK